MRWVTIRSLGLALAALAVAGCASGPLSEEGVARNLQPGDVRSEPTAHQGKTILWGGEIVASRNLPERTRLEIVAYPLDRYTQRPELEQEPRGRFRAYQSGYLETSAYAPGRSVTLRGQITGTETGKVDETDYTYPTVAVEAIELWPPKREVQYREPQFHFGFGVIRRY